MADCGSNSLESGSQNSSGGSSTDAVRKKIKVPKVVKSRYMQFEKPKNVKNNAAANTTILSAGKSLEKPGSGARKSLAPQRLKAPPTPANAADGSFVFKDDLQSTLLDGHKIARPELDFSVINDKTMQKVTPKSLATAEQRKPKRDVSSTGSVPEDVIEMLESQTLIFTYLAMKMQKNLRRLEDKAERSLLQLHDEKMKLQERVQELKMEQLLSRREETLQDLLQQQAESLAPPVAATTQFKDNYTSFARALDGTRHQLPIRDVHVPGPRQRFLEDVQKHLDSTKSLLEAVIHRSADDGADALDTVKDLEDVVLKTDAELSRSLHQVLDLSCKVNKEASLQFQRRAEESAEPDVVRTWYFDQGN